MRYSKEVVLLCIAVCMHASAQGAAADEIDGLAEVTVTATKRDQSLQEVPLSVTALTDKELQARGVDSFADYARSVPAVSFVDLGVGRQRVAIRGVDSKIGSPVVGYYLDESPVPSTTSYTAEQVAIDPKLGDVERIEVLRGPQGTVYGAGSMGGTIKIVPKAPDVTKFESFVTGSVSTTNSNGHGVGLGATGMLNLPLVDDRLALRVVGWYRDEDGFIERRTATPASRAANEASGAPLVFEDTQRVPDEETTGARASLGYHLTDRVLLQASVFYQNADFGGFQDITTGALNANEDLVQNMLTDVAERNNNRLTLTNLKIEADLGFASLVSSFSQFKRSLLMFEETTAVLESFGFAPNPYGGPITERSSNKSFSAETRLASNASDSKLEWLVGVFYDENEGEPTVDWWIPGFGATFGLSSDNLFTSKERSRAEQKAVFGELNYHLTDAVTLTGGLRRFEATQVQRLARNGAFTELPDDVSTPDPSTATPTRGTSKDTIYKFALDWRLTKDAMVYAQASEGFRPGFGVVPAPTFCAEDLAALGFTNTPSQVDPDSLWNYEVGAKTDWADGRVRVNVAAYQIDWSRIQNSVFLACGFPLITNLGELRNRGAEFEVNARLTHNLSVGFSTGYLDSALKDNIFGIDGTAGQPLPDTPEWTGSTFIEATFPVAGNWRATARTDFSYTSGSISAYTVDTPIVADKGPLSLLDARLTLERENVEVAVFARNLLDDVERTALVRSVSINVPDRLRYSVNRPRTFGVNVTWRY